MRRPILFITPALAAIVGACQAFTGTGDLEVRDGGPTSGEGGGTAVTAGGTGGAGGVASVAGSGGAAQVTSASTSMMDGSQQASVSASSGMPCVNCGTAFTTTVDLSTVCRPGKVAYLALVNCLCGDGVNTGTCWDGMTHVDCGSFCLGATPDAICVGCAQNPDMGFGTCMTQYSACIQDM